MLFVRRYCISVIVIGLIRYYRPKRITCYERATIYGGSLSLDIGSPIGIEGRGVSGGREMYFVTVNPIAPIGSLVKHRK